MYKQKTNVLDDLRPSVPPSLNNIGSLLIAMRLTLHDGKF